MTGNTDNVSPSASPLRGYQWRPYEESEAEKQSKAYLRQELEWAAPDNRQPSPDVEESWSFTQTTTPSSAEHVRAEQMQEFAAYQAGKEE